MELVGNIKEWPVDNGLNTENGGCKKVAREPDLKPMWPELQVTRVLVNLY